MHAGDYKDIAAAAAAELSFLETHELRLVAATLPQSLKAVVDNLLIERRWKCYFA